MTLEIAIAGERSNVTEHFLTQLRISEGPQGVNALAELQGEVCEVTSIEFHCRSLFMPLSRP